MQGSYVNDRNNVQSADLYSTGVILPPNAPSVFSPDGSLNWAPTIPGQPGTFNNPYAQLENSAISNTVNLVSNANFSYTVFPGLEIKSNFGYTSLRTDGVFLAPSTNSDPAYNVLAGSSIFQNSNSHTWIAEPQVTYKFNIGNGTLTSLVGGTFQENNISVLNLNAYNFSSDALIGNIQAAGLVYPSATASQYKYNAIFGRLNYNWKDKYLINGNIRRDGSSRFGPNKQFHTFLSIGGAWIFSEEKLIKDNLPFLSFGKLRASYGTAGSDNIPNYLFLDLYNAQTSGGGTRPYQGLTTLAPTNLFNPNLQWEETKKLEYGLDLGFFKDRLTLSASYYKNRTGNQLVSQALPRITGFGSVVLNQAAIVENKGYEFTLQSLNIKSKQVRWSTSFNLSANRNQLVAYPGLAQTGLADYYFIGKPVGTLRAYKYAGVNPATGLYQAYNAKGELISRPTSDIHDQTSFLDLTPRYYGGIENSVKYQGFTLDFLFQFVKQKGENIFGILANTSGAIPGMMFNEPAIILNRWQKPGDIATFQQYTTTYGPAYAAQVLANQSDRNYSDASYVRLKNVSLSWELPKTFVSKFDAQNVRIYFQAQNLLTFTKYNGIDPETQSYTTPPTNVMTVGIQFTF